MEILLNVLDSAVRFVIVLLYWYLIHSAFFGSVCKYDMGATQGEKISFSQPSVTEDFV